MKAVLFYEFGDVNQLRYQEAPIPVCGKEEVLVRIRATSVNPIDWKIRSGSVQDRMPVKLPFILGRDVAGDVVENRSAITLFPVGTRVMALGLHSYAQFAVVKATALAKIPDSMELEQAGSLPLILTTGCQLIERAIKPVAGQTLLVTGALGSVGRTAVYVAKQHGVTVLAGVRGSQRKDAAGLGADRVVALDDESEIAELRELDAIADTVGGETITKLFKALKTGGVIGSVVGPLKTTIAKRLRVEAFMAEPDAKRLGELAADVAEGAFSIPIVRSVPLSDVREAQALAEKGKAGGKVVLIP